MKGRKTLLVIAIVGLFVTPMVPAKESVTNTYSEDKNVENLINLVISTRDIMKRWEKEKADGVNIQEVKNEMKMLKMLRDQLCQQITVNSKNIKRMVSEDIKNLDEKEIRLANLLNEATKILAEIDSEISWLDFIVNNVSKLCEKSEDAINYNSEIIGYFQSYSPTHGSNETKKIYGNPDVRAQSHPDSDWAGSLSSSSSMFIESGWALSSLYLWKPSGAPPTNQVHITFTGDIYGYLQEWPNFAIPSSADADYTAWYWIYDMWDNQYIEVQFAHESGRMYQWITIEKHYSKTHYDYYMNNDWMWYTFGVKLRVYSYVGYLGGGAALSNFYWGAPDAYWTLDSISFNFY